MEMRETADDESVLIAQACLPGVVAIKQAQMTQRLLKIGSRSSTALQV
jgi:hypothetical protein